MVKIGCAVAHLRQKRGRNVQQTAYFSIPRPAADVVKHGAGGICGIGGMNAAPGEIPDQPSVHSAKGQLAAIRALAMRPSPGSVEVLSWAARLDDQCEVPAAAIEALRRIDNVEALSVTASPFKLWAANCKAFASPAATAFWIRSYNAGESSK